MKLKKIIPLLVLLIVILFPSAFVLAEDSVIEPELTAKAALLIDTRTNKILYQKNASDKMYPASTTKIVTAILTLENCNLNDVVTASYEAVMSIPDGYSIAHIQIGEQLTVEQLLQLLLVHSANDAANVLAEHVGGSIDSFVAMMNTKVNELGLTNTHFTNPYGKHDDTHYTTAYDLAMIFKYCLKNETFRKIAGSASCAIPATTSYGPRSYPSTNEMLISNNRHYYRYLTAGKTGYTSVAKECLVSSAYKDNLELICVILGANSIPNTSSIKIDSNRFSETKSLYEYGYSNYSIQNIANENDIATQIEIKNATENTKKLDLMIAETIPALIQNTKKTSDLSPEIIIPEDLTAPIEEGTVVGKIKYVVDGVEYTTNLLASHTVEKSKLFEYILYIVGVMVILLILYWIFYSSKKKKVNF